MSAQANVVKSTAQPPRRLSEELNDLRPELEKVLPAHVTVDKFLRVVNTAISQNPDLYRADRRSLFTSCVKCATDGLVPDGREAALTIFNTKEKFTDDSGKKGERWVKKVQYMPMVYGIQKKIRNSGELLSLTCNPVFAKDDFNYWIDDVGEHITHKPNITEADRGGFLCVYAIAKTKDGGVYTEVMTRGQIEQVRGVSKAKDSGPWKDWFDEMARKTVIRRISKRLPMSTDIERVIQRDDNLYELSNPRVNAQSGTEAAKALLGLTPQPELIEGVDEDGVIVEGDDSAGDDPDSHPMLNKDQALAELRVPVDQPGLEKIWVEIGLAHSNAKREIDPDVEDLYKIRKEELTKL